MKKIATAVLFAGFGTFAMSQQINQTPVQNQMEMKHAKKGDKMQDRGEMEKKHMAEMQKDLNLSPNQVSQIQALHNKNKADRQVMREAKMKEMQAKRDQNDAEMKKILSPEQYAKWQVKKTEMKKEKKEKFRGKKGGFKGEGRPEPMGM